MIKINDIEDKKTRPFTYKNTRSAGKTSKNIEFKQAVNYKYEVKIKEELNQLIKKIDDYGKLFSKNPSQNNISLYKKHIQTFFQFVSSSAFKIKEIYGKKIDYKIVTCVNNKIEELYIKTIKKEASRIDILHSLNEIKGLLINMIL